jgi:hypothetical protein
VIQCGRFHLHYVVNAGKNVFGTRILSLTPTEKNETEGHNDKQKRQNKTKKQKIEVEWKKNEFLQNFVYGSLFVEW